MLCLRWWLIYFFSISFSSMSSLTHSKLFDLVFNRNLNILILNYNFPYLNFHMHVQLLDLSAKQICHTLTGLMNKWDASPVSKKEQWMKNTVFLKWIRSVTKTWCLLLFTNSVSSQYNLSTACIYSRICLCNQNKLSIKSCW